MGIMHLNPSMALASALAYSCRCMRQLRWWRAAAMLATSATWLDVRAGDLCRCVGTSAPTQVPGESDQPITGPSRAAATPS